MSIAIAIAINIILIIVIDIVLAIITITLVIHKSPLPSLSYRLRGGCVAQHTPDSVAKLGFELPASPLCLCQRLR